MQPKRGWPTILCLLAMLASAPVGAAELEPFGIKYEVHHSGARVAETSLTLAPALTENGYQFSSRTQPKGLAKLIRPGEVLETSLFGFADGKFKPLDYHFVEGSRKGKRDSRISFDWTQGSAHSRYKGNDEALPLTDGVVDRLLVQLVLMHDLGAGLLPKVYAVIDRNEIKNYEFRVLGEETLATPAGQFLTIKVRRQRPGSSRATIIWAATELAFLPVKMVQLKDERPTTVLTVIGIENDDDPSNSEATGTH